MSGKREWDQTMAEGQRGGRGRAVKSKGKRSSSGRTVVLSKAVRVVDEETRKQVRNARLEALEADNYVEEVKDEGGDEAYTDSDDEDSKKKQKKRKKAAGRRDEAQTRTWKVKPLSQIIFETGMDDGNGPNIVTAAAAPSTRPRRKFCTICGLFAPHACPRCGSRHCSLRCSEKHEETQCMKFAA